LVRHRSCTQENPVRIHWRTWHLRTNCLGLKVTMLMLGAMSVLLRPLVSCFCVRTNKQTNKWSVQLGHSLHAPYDQDLEEASSIDCWKILYWSVLYNITSTSSLAVYIQSSISRSFIKSIFSAFPMICLPFTSFLTATCALLYNGSIDWPLVITSHGWMYWMSW